MICLLMRTNTFLDLNAEDNSSQKVRSDDTTPFPGIREFLYLSVYLV